MLSRYNRSTPAAGMEVDGDSDDDHQQQPQTSYKKPPAATPRSILFYTRSTDPFLMLSSPSDPPHASDLFQAPVYHRCAAMYCVVFTLDLRRKYIVCPWHLHNACLTLVSRCSHVNHVSKLRSDVASLSPSIQSRKSVGGLTRPSGSGQRVVRR